MFQILYTLCYSDFHDIVNGQGELLTTLMLSDLQNSQLIKTYGVPSIALSLALQRYLL
jgi:hypothetical protein